MAPQAGTKPLAYGLWEYFKIQTMTVIMVYMCHTLKNINQENIINIQYCCGLNNGLPSKIHVEI
jgi:hypothetical protein